VGPTISKGRETLKGRENLAWGVGRESPSERRVSVVKKAPVSRGLGSLIIGREGTLRIK